MSYQYLLHTLVINYGHITHSIPDVCGFLQKSVCDTIKRHLNMGVFMYTLRVILQIWTFSSTSKSSDLPLTKMACVKINH